MSYALDSNIVSALLRGELHDKLVNELDNGVTIPPIVYYEVKRGLLAVNATAKLTAFKQLCNMLGVGTLDTESLDRASVIYAKLKNAGELIDDADLLIGAYCLTHGYTLITDNTRHFERIDGLKHENWLSA